LVKELVDRLTGKDMAVTYEFNNLKSIYQKHLVLAVRSLRVLSGKRMTNL
jgi:hypothetical protein